jgi:hypothetical protein
LEQHHGETAVVFASRLASRRYKKKSSSHLLHIHNDSTLRNAADAVGALSRLEGLEGCKHAALRGDLVGILSSMRHIALPCFYILSCARIICEAMDAQW